MVRTNMRMFAQNEKIYIYIFGASVEDSHAGIYRLEKNTPKSSWTKVLSGRPASYPILSPDGCRFSFQFNGKLIVSNACAADSTNTVH
jgi:hypothetical protein